MRWVALGIASYAGLVLLVLCMVRAATTADRSERLVISDTGSTTGRVA
jgi:hypothetical protein